MKKIGFFLLFLFLAVQAVQAAYEPPSSEIVLFADEEGGVVSSLTNQVRVPVFCLYKDGRLIYSGHDASGFTYLMETRLDEKAIEEVKALFSGSDEWNDSYENVPFPDMPLLRLTFNDGSGEIKRFSVRGPDYALRTKSIPPGLAALYRYVSRFEDAQAKEYVSEEIFLYVREMEREPEGAAVRIFRWRNRLSLAPIAMDAGRTGYGAVRLDGKQAKNVIRDLTDKVPYTTADLPVFFSQGKSFYSLGFRPLLPHELETGK